MAHVLPGLLRVEVQQALHVVHALGDAHKQKPLEERQGAGVALLGAGLLAADPLPDLPVLLVPAEYLHRHRYRNYGA